MTQAIPFITYKDKTFEIHPEAASFFLSLQGDDEVSVVSVIGKYRSGKSYLIN